MLLPLLFYVYFSHRGTINQSGSDKMAKKNFKSKKGKAKTNTAQQQKDEQRRADATS
jgi:hypothetical protein